MSRLLRILLVESSDDDAQMVRRELERTGSRVVSARVETANGLKEALARESWDIVLSDSMPPKVAGSEVLAIVQSVRPELPVILIAPKAGQEAAIELMRSGARDLIFKDDLARLGPAVERELRNVRQHLEYKKLEEQYRQAQKMEALGQLAGGVAHDFNNLLTIINGFSDLLLAKMSSGDSSRSFLDRIRQAGDRCSALTRQLLIFSRKQTPSFRVLDLNSLVGEAEKMLGRVLGENIKFVADLGPRLRSIKGDPGQLEQVLFNLVVNARDAMPRGGQVTVRTRNMTFAEGYSLPIADMPYGNYVMLEVTDVGEGISKENSKHLFEPFYTTKEAGKGTGLGLVTVFGIVKQSSGHIAIDSKQGKGTSVRIYIPEIAQRAEHQSETAPNGAFADLRGNEAVLIVEDEEGVRSLLSKILVHNGYTVLEAGTGGEALRLAGNFGSAIHLMITDIMMPEISGPELAKLFREAHPETKVLFISGYSTPPNLEEYGLDGKVAFLAKPLSPLKLTTEIRKLLDSGAEANQLASANISV
ncbi:MAG: response regulator [Gemmataceae bacterium]|nr:response regulator [Gemmataceae bacterium]